MRESQAYPAEIRDTLMRSQSLRYTADFEPHWVTETQATRALRRTRSFLETVEGGGTR